MANSEGAAGGSRPVDDGIPAAAADRDLVEDLLELAMELALGAARLIRREVGFTALSAAAAPLEISAKSTLTDVVTHVDRAVEEWLLDALARRRPADDVLAEESGGRSAAEATGGVRWIIDPIDGTVNFVRGLPRFAVSIAVEVHGEVRAGCVLNPSTGDLFWASKGGGAWYRRLDSTVLDSTVLDSTVVDSTMLDEPVVDASSENGDRGLQSGGRRLTGPPPRPLALKVVATGFSYDAGRRGRQAEVVSRLITRVADIRRLGAASLDLCSVALGEVDAYYEVGLSPWDYAAGALVAAEAGCQVTGLHGRSASPLMTVASGDPSLEFFALLEELGAGSVLDEP